MPTYEYACDGNAEHNWEQVQSIKDAPATVCPSCDGPAHRLISRSNFALKGGGWYAEGYGATPPSQLTPATTAPRSGVSDAAMAAATTCPTSVPTKP